VTPDRPIFNGVEVFSATMPVERARLGERVTEWIRIHARCEIAEIEVVQSSDAFFHCVSIIVFYRELLQHRDVVA